MFQYDLVTQRVKEQKVSFTGIVMHVKQFVSKIIHFVLNQNLIRRERENLFILLLRLNNNVNLMLNLMVMLVG